MLTLDKSRPPWIWSWALGRRWHHSSSTRPPTVLTATPRLHLDTRRAPHSDTTEARARLALESALAPRSQLLLPMMPAWTKHCEKSCRQNRPFCAPSPNDPRPQTRDRSMTDALESRTVWLPDVIPFPSLRKIFQYRFPKRDSLPPSPFTGVCPVFLLRRRLVQVVAWPPSPLPLSHCPQRVLAAVRVRRPSVVSSSHFDTAGLFTYSFNMRLGPEGRHITSLFSACAVSSHRASRQGWWKRPYRRVRAPGCPASCGKRFIASCASPVIYQACPCVVLTKVVDSRFKLRR